MKKVFVLLFILSISLMYPYYVYAQGMMGRFRAVSEPTQNATTTEEEARGKAIWDKLQSKQIQCVSLKDDDFDVLGEYFMGQKLGSSHAAMNTMMTRMMGEEGETQMHVSFGKRLSGCDTTTPFSVKGSGFFPTAGGFWGPGMMWRWNGGWSIVCNIVWLLVIIFLVLGILYFWKEITKKRK